MKRLLLMLTLLFALTACTVGVSESESITQNSEPARPQFTVVADIADVMNPEKIKILENMGIKVELVGKGGEDKIYVRLTNNSHELLLDYTLGDILAINYWGGNIVVVNPDNLTYYWSEDFHHVETFTVTDFEGRLIDAIPHGHGFMALYIDGEEYGLAKFRASGGFMYKLPLNLGQDNPVMYDYGVPKRCPHLTYMDKSIYVTDKSQSQLMFVSQMGFDRTGSYNSFVYNLTNNTFYYPDVIVYNESDNGQLLVIGARPERYADGLNSNIPAKAFVLKDGNPTGYVEFDTEYLKNGDFDFSHVETVFTGKNTVEIYSHYTGVILDIDFAKGTVHKSVVSDEMKNNKLQFKYATSSDGRYSLWAGESEGGGDVSYTKVYLVNNADGSVKFIDNIGGMYGGSESCGFFSNGDMYTIGLDEFKVFTTDMSQQAPVFEMSKNFPLGSELEGDIYFRHLLAARRDPDTHSWVVLYNEAPYEADANNWYMEGDLGDNFYKFTYKIGILDQQGNLTQVYDTGEYVMTYDFRQVKMYMAAGNVLNFEVVIKGKETQLHGQLNLNTGEYTCISGGYNRWNKN